MRALTPAHLPTLTKKFMTKVTMRSVKMVKSTRKKWWKRLVQPERPLAQNLTLRLTLRKTDF